MFYNNIETNRLILKNIDMEDRDFIFNQFSNDEINKYLLDAEPLKDINEADEVIEFYLASEPRPQHRWIMIRKSDGIKIGTCGFHCWDTQNCEAEIGYDLKIEFWGNGYMFEALGEIINFSKKSMELQELKACIYIENNKSIKLAEKLGFILTGSKYEVSREEKYLHNIYSLRF